MKTGVTEKGDGKDFAKALAVLAENRVLVGIPDANAGRTGQVTNAQLLFIHSRGSPKKGIPARPVVEPAIEQGNVSQGIAELLKAAAIAAIEQGEDAAISGLQKAGLYAETAVKDYFVAGNNWPPNSQETIDRKGSDAPLIDTGALRGSITHVIRKVGE